jgi:hypothetical protein
MDAKVLVSGSVGFAAVVVVTLLVGGLLMGGMMGGMMGRGGMMRNWGCSSSEPSVDFFSEDVRTAPETAAAS